MKNRLTEIPYCHDSAQLFAHFAEEPWSILLDSGYPSKNCGRYDIIAARPHITLKTFADQTEIQHSDGKKTYTDADPFTTLENLLGETEKKPSTVPFAGGALGYFGYDLGRQIEKIPNRAKHDIDMPDMAIGIYDWAIVTDHQKRRTWLASYGKIQQTLDQWQDLKDLLSDRTKQQPIQPFRVTSEPKSNMDKQHYAYAFNAIKRYLKQGDCYQVNLAQRFTINYSGDPWSGYRQLRRLSPAPYSSFFRIPEGTILSNSPERFLHIDQGNVESKPIKGTRPRASTPHADMALREELINSEKDRTENLMIVDLIRNDLSKICEYNSVTVPKLYNCESFATVHHLVSTIHGKLESKYHPLQLLRHCFPGGSITGVPKIRAMQIIEQLEPHRRSIYCGSIAYIGFDRNIDSNIIIRTLIQHKDQMHYWAGGGIVIDSKLDAEYQECLDKAAALFALPVTP